MDITAPDAMGYIKYASQQPKVILVYVAVVTLTFFVFWAHGTAQERFLVVALAATVLGYYYQSTNASFQKDFKLVTGVKQRAEELTDTEYAVKNVYAVHKKPAKLKYVYLNKDVLDVIRAFDFMKTFDAYAHDRLIVLLENFYRIYYKTVDGKYDVRVYFPMLRDLRTEILNLVSEFYFNVPQFSNNVEGNIYEIIDTNLDRLRKVTHRCLRILAQQGKQLYGIDLPAEEPAATEPRQTIGTLFY